MLMGGKTKKIIFSILIMGGFAAGFIFLQSANVSIADADTDGIKCEFHGIDADLCSRCNPELIPEFRAKGDWCEGHNMAESQCDLCGFGETHGIENEHAGHDHSGADIHDETKEMPTLELNDNHNELEIHRAEHEDTDHASAFSAFFPDNIEHCATDEAIIQLASIKTAERAGLTIRPAMAGESSPFLEAPAEVVFDENATTVLSTTIPSLVRKWLVEPGQKLAGGAPLAQLSSPEIPEMKAFYLEAHASFMLARKQHDRQMDLHKRELISDSEFEDSETKYALAEARLIGQKGMLKSAGMSDDDIQDIIKNKRVDQTLHIHAPSDGVVIERLAIPGQLMEEGMPLAIMGDPDALWIEAQISEDKVKYLSVGDRIEFSSDGGSHKKCTGRIIWISRFLDRGTRTLTVRAEIESASDILHSGEFGRIIIEPSNETTSVIVPKDAVQWEGCCNVVFVKETIDRFHPRKVRIEPADNGYYRILDGLLAGEEIVIDGSYLLKTELRKGSLGAGCSGH